VHEALAAAAKLRPSVDIAVIWAGHRTGLPVAGRPLKTLAAPDHGRVAGGTRPLDERQCVQRRFRRRVQQDEAARAQVLRAQ
jgi:hypothetical protein